MSSREPPSRRSNVRRTNVTACKRCRSRKQRCDQNLPACSNCERAGVACVSTDIDGKIVPRSYIQSLEDRVAYLESQLVDQGSLDLPDPDEFAESRPSGTSSSRDPIERVVSRSLDADVFYTGNTITTSNGQSLLRSLLAEPIRSISQTSKPKNQRALLDDLASEAQAPLPSRDGAKLLIDAYFEHCEFFSPIISSKDAFSSSIALLYDEHSTPGCSSASPSMFRAYIVFATAVLLLNRTDSGFPIARADRYFASATRLLAEAPAVICTGDLSHLCNLLLVAQYCCFASNLSGAWHFVGLASRLAVELGLHDERAVDTRLGRDDINQRRWLFWAFYTLERNLCVVVRRPFSIPDEAIHTPMPELAEGDGRALALHLIKHRRLESEIYATLNQKSPVNGAVLDLFAWRDSMRRRVIEWSTSTPTTAAPSTQLAPTEIFSFILHIDLVLLYYPSAAFPDPSQNDILIIAQSASESISNYRRAFRDGQLRFFWRTTHNLFKSGVAMAYCLHLLNSMHHFPDLDQADMAASVNTCMSVLWAMVERYPPGSVYRDAYELLSNSVLRSGGNVGTLASVQHQGSSQLALEPSFWADMAVPHASLDDLNWGFGNFPWH